MFVRIIHARISYVPYEGLDPRQRCILSLPQFVDKNIDIAYSTLERESAVTTGGEVTRLGSARRVYYFP